MTFKYSLLLCACAAGLGAQDNAANTQPVSIRFRGVVGAEDFSCGRSYTGIGMTQSTIRPKDFRFYVHNFRVLNEKGEEIPIQLTQDDKWQLDDLALVDFENATGACSNGTPETNTAILGTLPAGHTYRGLRFTIGVPFEKNHTDITSMPSPLNLTSMAWVWNAGHKFMRIEFSSTGQPRGNVLHLGSTGCTPNTTRITVPTTCAHPNRPEISLPEFDPKTDAVFVDLAALLKDSNVDVADKEFGSGCMSSAKDPNCEPLFANLGLSLKGDSPAITQTVFRSSANPASPSATPVAARP